MGAKVEAKMGDEFESVKRRQRQRRASQLISRSDCNCKPVLNFPMKAGECLSISKNA